MYLDFFGLNEKPFGLTPDPKFLFFSEKHREALDHLLYGIHQKEGFVLISGDTGTGKTTLCRALLERLDPREVSTALILNPLLSEEELLRAVLEDFGLPATGTSRKELVDELNRFLLKTLAAGKAAVLIIDEAQNLSIKCLEQVRLLSNLETDKEKLIQIILVGSEELPTKLEQPKLRHLQQRISLRYHLRPLNRQEARRYVQHRLNMARAAGSTAFEKRAYDEIYRFSKGVPRLINIIAERSMLAGYLAESRKIKRAHVLEGRQSLSGTFPSSRRRFFLWFSRQWQRAPLALFLLVIGIGLLLVPAVQDTLRHYLQERFTPVSYAPAKDSRKSIKAAIPAPEERGFMSRKKAGQPVSERGTVSGQANQMSPVAQATNQGDVEAGAVGQQSPKAGGVTQKKVALARTESRARERGFPQYILKPPYVYTVQVESFKGEDKAAARMQELRSRGFDAWVAWIDLGEMGIWYRVLVGKYKDKSEAQIMARKLSSSREFHRARQIATHKESAEGRGAQ
jgi:general secretion pathway protein A